jgi:hypothetical protein
VSAPTIQNFPGSAAEIEHPRLGLANQEVSGSAGDRHWRPMPQGQIANFRRVNHVK